MSCWQRQPDYSTGPLQEVLQWSSNRGLTLTPPLHVRVPAPCADMDGFKLLEVVGLEMDLPVIMISGNDDTQTVRAPGVLLEQKLTPCALGLDNVASLVCACACA